MNASHKWRRTVLVSIVLFAAVSLVSLSTMGRVAALRLSDTLFRAAPAPAERSNVVLVLIDDESLQKYGRWPWPRPLLAQLVGKIEASGAQVIGLDILLSESESGEADEALATAIRQANGIIVDKIGAYRDDPRWIEPVSVLSQAASAVGHAQAVLDIDGVCRRFPPQELTIDGTRWAFAIEAAKRVAPQRTEAFLNSYGLSLVADQAGPVRTAAPQMIRVPYRKDGFDKVPAARVLERESTNALRGRWVLVGFGPAEIADRINTPLSGELPSPGVEVHAQILDGIARNRIVREMPLWAIVLVLVAASIASAVSVQRWGGWKAILWMICAGCVSYVGSLAVFAYSGWIAPVAGVLFVVCSAPVVGHASDFIVVERILNRQLRELQFWLAANGNTREATSENGVFWRLAVLRELQTRLGALYELQDSLLETTPDAVAIFNARGELMFQNRRFRECFDPAGLTFSDLRTMLEGSDNGSVVESENGLQGELTVGGEPHSFRTAVLPVTTMAPSGGTLVLLTSLKMREERDQARAEALGFVTHELRTPITAIQGFAEIMIRYPGSPSTATAPETILRESKRLLALIHNYLDVLRMDAGARPIQQESVSIDEVVRETFELVQPLAHSTSISLLSDNNVDVPLTGDRALIGGAILNLVSNAIKYGRRGSTVTVRTTIVEGGITVSVHNLCEPIPQEDLARIFDSFYRGRKTEQSRAGWGLGLAFVKRIAEKHGGNVHASSGPEGTTFEICLPAQQHAAAQGAA